MDVMVIGGAIAGLVAAHAIHQTARLTGAGVFIVHPAMAEHTWIQSPQVNELFPDVVPQALFPTTEVEVRTQGDPADWPTKIGCPPDKHPDYFGGMKFRAVSARSMFNALGQHYEVSGWVRSEVSFEQLTARTKPDLVINTFRRDEFCVKPEEHLFLRNISWATDVPMGTLQPGQVVLNAEPSPGWFKSSNIEDRYITQWAVEPPFDSVFPVDRPVRSTCDCPAPGGGVHVGPEATYNPLSGLFDVYTETAAAVMAWKEARDGSR